MRRLLAGLLLVLLVAPSLAQVQVGPSPPGGLTRGPIRILSDSDFTPVNGVKSGVGSQASPYIIEGWQIQTDGSSTSCAICISDTTSYFVVRNVQVQVPSGASWQYGVLLDTVRNGVLESNLLQGSDTALRARGNVGATLVQHNRLTGNACGIDFDGQVSVLFTDNYVSNARNVCVPNGANLAARFFNAPAAGQNVAGGSQLAGNYWSDYQGQDANGDRIGEEPYVVSRVHSQLAIQDDYPILPVPKPLPQVTLTLAAQDGVYSPYTVNFTAVARGDARITGYEWSFGDGEVVTTTQPTAEHTYYGPGPFQAFVQVTDIANDRGTSNAVTVAGKSQTTVAAELIPRHDPYQDMCDYGSYEAPCIKYNVAPLAGERPFEARLELGVKDANDDERGTATIEWGDGEAASYAIPDHDVGANGYGCVQREMPSCILLSHAYESTGVYFVKATFNGLGGKKDTDVIQITVRNAAPVIRNFTVLDSSGALHAPGQRLDNDADGPEAVRLKADAYDPDGHIVDYSWNIRGLHATGEEVLYVEPVTQFGSYVELVVTDEDGQETRATYPAFNLKPDPMNPSTPTVSITGPGSVVAGVPATYSATAQDPDGISEIWWNFGDGTFTKGATVSHAWSQQGSATVVAVAIDAAARDNQVAAMASKPVQVTAGTQSLAIVTTPHHEGEAPLILRLSALNAKPDSTLLWKLPSGLTEERTPTERFDTPGAYDLTVYELEASGTSRRATLTAVATGAGPLAVTPEAEPRTGRAPVSIDFVATVQNAYGRPVAYDWDFGDGALGTGAQVRHTYTIAGDFTARVTATAGEETATNQLRVFVTQGPSVFHIRIESSNDRGPTPRPVELAANWTPFIGVPSTFTWDFGDGSQGDGETVTHTFQERRQYTVIVVGRDNLNRSVTAQRTIDLRPGTLIAASDLEVKPDEPIAFVYRGGDAHWDFGDGNTSFGASVQHTYAKPGTFAVRVAGPQGDDEISIKVANPGDVRDIPIPGVPILLAALAVAACLRRRRT